MTRKGKRRPVTSFEGVQVSNELNKPRYKAIPSKAKGRVRIAKSSLKHNQVVVLGGGFSSYSTYNIDTAQKMAARRKKILKKRRK